MRVQRLAPGRSGISVMAFILRRVLLAPMWTSPFPRSIRMPPMDRPPHVKPPAHWGASPPVPEPQEVKPPAETDGQPDPTRYGDWERKGIAIDF